MLNTANEKGWMMTYTGKRVFPLDVKIDDIDIRDIAHSLALQCRFNGHVSDFYSVAEHSLLICKALQKNEVGGTLLHISALLHDAAETYLSDMIRPLKISLADAYGPIRRAGEKIDLLIADKYGLPRPFAPIIHEYDHRIINDEKRVLFGTEKPWDHGGQPLGVDIQCYDPREAERRFKFEFYNLMEQMERLSHA